MPRRGRGGELRIATIRHHSRSCEPPPQSLRDSSPSGGAFPDPLPKFSP